MRCMRLVYNTRRYYIYYTFKLTLHFLLKVAQKKKKKMLKLHKYYCLIYVLKR